MDLAVIREILECHICYETMKETIYVCETGHTVCVVCFGKLVRCPTCQAGYTGTRSFIAERLSAELERIDPEFKNKLPKKSSPTAASAMLPTDLDEFRGIQCPLEFNGCNKSTIDFFEYINHLRDIHGVVSASGQSYTKRFTTKGQVLVRGGSSRMFIVTYHDRNFLFTALEDDGEVRVWATLEGSADEMSQYKVKMTLHAVEREPDNCLTEWYGSILSMRTTAFDVRQDCLRVQSTLLAEHLPAIAIGSWDKWYVTIKIFAVTIDLPHRIAFSNQEPIPARHAAVDDPISIIRGRGDRRPVFLEEDLQPGATLTSARARMLGLGPANLRNSLFVLSSDADSSDQDDLRERARRLLRTADPAERPVVRPRLTVPSSSDDDDSTMRARPMAFQNLPEHVRMNLERTEGLGSVRRAQVRRQAPAVPQSVNPTVPPVLVSTRLGSTTSPDPRTVSRPMPRSGQSRSRSQMGIGDLDLDRLFGLGLTREVRRAPPPRPTSRDFLENFLTQPSNPSAVQGTNSRSSTIRTAAAGSNDHTSSSSSSSSATDASCTIV